MKKWRFFYHYYKQKGKMSIHWKGSCAVVDDIECNVPCETHWNSTQPKLVMRGWAKNVQFIDNKAVIT